MHSLNASSEIVLDKPFETSPNKPAENSTSWNSELSILEALGSFDLPLALLDAKTSKIVFLSEGLKKIEPNLKLGDCWALVNARPQAEQLNVSAFDENGVCQQISIGNTHYSIRMQSLTSGHCLVSLIPLNNETDDLYQYMQSRDSLFSTSRTISVSEMATTLAHEINTPVGTITNILGGLKLRLRKSGTSTQVLDDALSKALEQTQYTQSVINRIRDFTYSRRPKYVVLDVCAQVSEAVSLLDWMLNKHHCRVKLALPEFPVRVLGDATMLQQVLINLLRNAIDAMEHQSPDKRLIVVGIEQKRDSMVVSVCDNGSGLESGAEKLFVPFATNKPDGMGVGLNICRSFVELHQGKLWLSDNVTDGCTSFMELPLFKAEQCEYWEEKVDG